MSGVNNNNSDMEKIEVCVSCGRDTPYTRQTNVQLRYWYVEGAGQLCQKCYTNVYDPGI